jgi:ferric-dicitrate binding protein FerR (iron transport regulator)
MRDNSTENARVIELMAKKMGRTASPKELEELARLLSINPGYSWLAEVVTSLKGSAEHVEKSMPGAELADSGWAHLAERMNAEPEKRGKVRSMSRVVRVAAAVLLGLAGIGIMGYYWWGRQAVGAAMKRTVEVGYGRKSMLVLADGTKVWLNAGSRLIYPASFTGKTREVQLEGEALFDVAQQAHQPFFVHTGKITVRVLGTRFDVKAYREDAQVSATLISGKIQVIMNEDPEKKILLSPHEKLTVMNVVGAADKADEPVKENELRYQVQFLAQAETDWVNNKMVFSNESFDEVARQMERRYAVHIEFDNAMLRREHVSGIFEKESLSQALEILKMTTRFNYKIDSNVVKLVADQN